MNQETILATGCSFTWGESLYFYSDLPNLPFSENHNFKIDSITDEMVKFKNEHRYLNLLSKELQIPYKYLNDDANGGSIVGSNHSLLYDIPTKYKDTKLFIWQITDWTRDVVGNNIFNVMNPINFFELMDGHIQKVIYFIKRIIDEFEKNGTSVILFSWQRDVVEHDLYQKFFIEKDIHMDIECEGETFICFNDIIMSPNEKFQKYAVFYDFKDKGLQKNDTHLNLKGHELIKKNLIKKIKQRNIF